MSRSPAAILFDVYGSQTAIRDGYAITPYSNGHLFMGTDGTQAHFIKLASDGTQIISEGKEVYLMTDALAPGNLTLADETWGSQNVLIRDINIVTSSTNFDLSICQTAEFDISLPTTRSIITGGSGNTLIPVNVYNRSSTNSLYIIYEDNSGSSTARFYITGIAK